jgi:diguanylate cyclase
MIIEKNNLALHSLNKINGELKLALKHFIDCIPASGHLANQIKTIKDALASNDTVFTFASLVEQYAKMKQSIDDFEYQESKRDLNVLKVMMEESIEKNLSPEQADKITEILAEINLEQPAHAIMVIVGRAIESFANDLSELRKSPDVVATKEKVVNKNTNVLPHNVVLASNKLIKEVVVILKQLTQTYPTDKLISKILDEATKIPNLKNQFFKSANLLEQSTKYLAQLIQQERNSTEEILNDIHANLVGVFKQSTVIDKLLASTGGDADTVAVNMVTELKNMEAKAQTIDTIAGMQKHINSNVALMSEIMNDYAKTQNQLHRDQVTRVQDLTAKVNNASSFIEKLEKKLNTLEESNLVDELTTVGNRKGYVQAINKERDSWLITNHPLTLMVIDVDRFKSINDSFGHSIGDQVLKCLAQTLQSSICSSDYVARYGGEEFVIILPATDLKQTIQIAKKLRKVVNSLKFELRKNNKALKITCSFGISNFTKDRVNTVDVFNEADKALYQAKEKGRDTIVASYKGNFISVDK